MPRTSTKLFIGRHAQADHMATPEIIAGRAPYSKLDKVGRNQAANWGRKLDQQGIKADIYHSSTSVRALQTMNNALMHRIGGIRPIISVPELQEQCLGEHEGRLRTDTYTPDVKQEMNDLGAKYRHPGYNTDRELGESGEDVIKRLGRYLAGLRAIAEPPETVVAVSHHVTKKWLHAGIELDAFAKPADPLELQAAMVGCASISPCAQSFLVVEGEPDALRVHIEYWGQPLEQI